MIINPKGSPSSPVWVVVDRPLPNDKDRGWVFSSAMGFVFDKMMKDAGFTDYYVKAMRDDLAHPEAINVAENFFIDRDGNGYTPPIIIPLGDCGRQFCKEMIPKHFKKADEDASEIEKYCGSLLKSPRLRAGHDAYVIPTFEPTDIVRQWKLRDIVVSCDLGKAFQELEYWRANGKLQPLPQRLCKIDFDSFDELLLILNNFSHYSILSNDIETVYPRDKSVWKGLHPGYPITIGLAPSADYGISFSLFRDNPVETRELWRTLNKCLKNVQNLGQNFFNFDINFYKMLGFEINEKHCIDTMIRHHILFPELPHKLQFLTRQYTREKYYKDEGHGWSVKDLRGLKHYNCLDVCVTKEVYDRQEEEFNERPHLR